MKKTIYIRSIGLFVSIISLLFSAIVYILSKSVLFAVLTNFWVMNLYTVFFKRNFLSHRELIVTIMWVSYNSIISCLVVVLLINYVLDNNVFLFIPIISVMFLMNFFMLINSRLFLKYFTEATGIENKKQVLKLTVIYILFLVLKILLSDCISDALYRNLNFENINVINLLIGFLISFVLCQVLYILFKKKINKLLYYSLIIPHIFIPYEYYFYLFFYVLLSLFDK